MGVESLHRFHYTLPHIQGSVLSDLQSCPITFALECEAQGIADRRQYSYRFDISRKG